MIKTVKKKVSVSIFGGLAGLINGLFGGGGGMVVVPTLTDLMGRDRKTAQATAMLVILPISLVSAFLYSAFGSVDASVLVPTAIGTSLGGVFGAFFLKKASNGVLFNLFYVFMLFAGLKMVF